MKTLHVSVLIVFVTIQMVLLGYFLQRFSPYETRYNRRKVVRKLDGLWDYQSAPNITINARHLTSRQESFGDSQATEGNNFLDVRWPRRLLYIWCGKNSEFTFVNYLSLTSAIRSINPSAVMFAMKQDPQPLEKTQYNRWIQELDENFPLLIRRNISVSDDDLCTRDNRRPTAIIRFLEKYQFRGCLFVSPRTIIVEPFVLGQVETLLDYYDAETRHGIIYVPENTYERPESKGIYNHIFETNVVTKNVLRGVCPVIKLATDNIPSTCFVLDHYKDEQDEVSAAILDPELIMFKPTPLASQLRLIFYGSRKYPEQKPDSRNPAPNIAHYVWLGGGNMSYTFFLSVLSSIYLGKVDTVFIHGDRPPGGTYWLQLQDMVIAKHIQLVKWHRPYSIYGQQIRYVQNQADVVKSSIMWTSGGILMDPDMMFVRAPDPEMFHYETLITYGGRPHMLNPAVTISKPHSEYARLWLESEKVFEADKYVWNCCYKMYKVWERKPQIAKVVRDFNLVCWNENCFPMWLHRDRRLMIGVDWMKNATDWRRRVVTAHFARPEPFKSFEQCAYELKGVAGEVARMILRASGLLRPHQGLQP